ncbi:MAG: hypothetical protein ACLPY5_05470 [Candidatus Bathyarchaeia archaeon]
MKTRSLVFGVLLLVAALVTVIPVRADNLATQFALPSSTGSACNQQAYTLPMYQGGGVSGTVVSTGPIYISIISNAQYQGLANDQNACNDVTTMGFLDSGSTSNYAVAFTAPYTATAGAPFYISFVNLGSSDVIVTVNLTTFI